MFVLLFVTILIFFFALNFFAVFNETEDQRNARHWMFLQSSDYADILDPDGEIRRMMLATAGLTEEEADDEAAMLDPETLAAVAEAITPETDFVALYGSPAEMIDATGAEERKKKFYERTKAAGIEPFDVLTRPGEFTEEEIQWAREHVEEQATPDEKKVWKEEKKRAKGLTKKATIAEQTRVLKQCYLLDRIKDLVRYRYSLPARAVPHHFSTVVDEPSKVLTGFLANPGAQRLLEMKDHEVAGLVPSIKFYRLIMTKKGQIVDEVEFPFRSHSGAVPNAISYDGLRSQRGQGDRAGIKSFSYDLAGTNPATADKFIKATAVFWFGSVNDLFADLSPLKRLPAGETPLSFRNLITYNDKPDEYSGEFFTIRAVSGWTTGASTLKIYDAEFEEAIKSAHTSFILSLIGHELDYNIDGSVTLTVEYNARMETALASRHLDVLWTPSSTVARKERKKQVALREQRRSIKLKLKSLAIAKKEVEALTEHTNILGMEQDTPVPSGTQFSPELEEISAELRARSASRPLPGKARQSESRLDRDSRSRLALGDKVEAEIASSKSQDKKLAEGIAAIDKNLAKDESVSKIRRYRRILEGLSKWKRIYTIRTDADQLGIWSAKQLSASTEESIADRTTPRTGAISQGGGKAAADAQKAGLDDAEKNAGKKGTKFDPKKIVVVDDDSNVIDESYDVRIPFFYLGDLLDILFEILRDTINGQRNTAAIETLDQFTFLVGGIVLTDPKTNKLNTFNLADFPISLDLFISWFQKNVIRTQRPRYELTELFKDILSELVIGGLGAGCLGGVKQLALPSYQPFTIQSGAGKSSRIPSTSRCRFAQIKSMMIGKVGATPRTAQQTQQVVYFYAKENQIDYLDGKLETNKKHNIYHMRLGRRTGLIKSVKFSKTEFKFLRSSRIAGQAQETNADGFLREKYDLEMTLVGNNLFFPGQMIYIDPSIPGGNRAVAGTTWLPARALGFSGYYFVNEAFHMAERNFYETQIKAVHQGFGTGGSRISPPDVFPPGATPQCKKRSTSDPPPKSVSAGGTPSPTPAGGEEEAAERSRRAHEAEGIAGPVVPNRPDPVPAEAGGAGLPSIDDPNAPRRVQCRNNADCAALIERGTVPKDYGWCNDGLCSGILP